MNFLAHLYLSGNNEDIICGNFIGDSVKGNQYQNYTAGIQKGILLHRAIDDFTDHHHIVAQSKSLLFPDYRHYSAVITDIFYDHFLAKNWNTYSHKPLKVFSAEMTFILEKHKYDFPEKPRLFLEYLIRYNVLSNYQYIDTIGQVLSGMSHRAIHESHMELAVKDLKEHYIIFEDHFNTFFPLLVAFANAKLNG